jgi:hypothetical protein
LLYADYHMKERVEASTPGDIAMRRPMIRLGSCCGIVE